VAAAFDSAHPDQAGFLTTPADVIRERELHRWQERCRHDVALADAPWPRTQALALLDAIIGSLATNETAAVDAAARAWARSSPSVSTLVRQMGALREVLADDDVCAFPDLDDRLARIMDQATVTATAAALAELEDAAHTDALTGVGNRRALEAAAKAALAAAERGGDVVSFAVIDLDGLKAINDTHGHAAGDHAIAGLTEALGHALRDTDQLFRIGGDEFVALLPKAAPDAVAESMARAAIDAPVFSWGVASAPDDGTRLEDLLDAADQRLYDGRRRARIGMSREPAADGDPGDAPATPAVPGGGRPVTTAPSASSGAAGSGTTPATATGASSMPWARPAVPGAQSRRRRRGIVAAVLVASAGLGVALYFLTKPSPGRPANGGTPGHHSPSAPVPARRIGGPVPGGTTGAGASPSGSASSGGASGTTGTGTSTGSGGTGTAGTATVGSTHQAGTPDPTTPPTTAPGATTTTLPTLPSLPTTTVPALP
jgi:diguanylate cyclase (GGDEF)-like protein